MPPQASAQKRLQTASPEKQKGVRSHDKKRRNVSITKSASDMDESEEDTYSSPAPLAVPPPPSMALLNISNETRHDTDGDTTMVSQSPPSSNAAQSPLPPDPDTPTPGSRSDPPWIIRRTLRSPVDPPFTQTEGSARPSLGVPRLPRSLTRTPTLVGGFPMIHLSTPPWFNLLPEQRTMFDTYPEPKFWIREWQASNATDQMATCDKLKELLQQMTGERTKLSTPQPEKELITRRRNDRHKPPFHFLVSGISERAGSILLSHPVISTPEASAFILPYNPPLPSFLCTLEGFTLSIRNLEAIQEAEECATDIVRKTLLDNEDVVTLLKSKLIDDTTSQYNLEPATEILAAIVVLLAKGEDKADRATQNKPRKPLWNVFFKKPPPVTWTNYFVLLQHVRNIKFVDMDYGSATPVEEEHRLHCFNCKGADHNPAQCSFATLVGWFGNKAPEKIEESAEFATSTRNERPYMGGGNRNDRRAESWRFGGRGLPYNQRRERR
ncbi:hypothetical protein C0992_005783 [Termitomyces sp. T32_za158]|nr:hypothetical protein C0992_005783 [Termitomyces sp. T32_za158]